MIRDMFRPVLSDRTIKRYNKKRLLITEPIPDEQLQPNSVDLTLGNTWKIIKSNSTRHGRGIIDPRLPIIYNEGEFHTDDAIPYFVMEPKGFALLASKEVLNIPNGIISFVQGRSSIARLSIQTEQAGLIDAGFCGTITFEVFNQSKYPIILFEGMRIAQVYFFKAQYADRAYDTIGKYNKQIEATGSRIDRDFNLSSDWQWKIGPNKEVKS